MNKPIHLRLDDIKEVQQRYQDEYLRNMHDNSFVTSIDQSHDPTITLEQEVEAIKKMIGPPPTQTSEPKIDDYNDGKPKLATSRSEESKISSAISKGQKSSINTPINKKNFITQRAPLV